MTTLVVSLSPALARRVARAADALGVSHAEVGAIAVRMFVAEYRRTHARTHARTRKVRASQRRSRIAS